jgi:hypothetical protein
VAEEGQVPAWVVLYMQINPFMISDSVSMSRRADSMVASGSCRMKRLRSRAIASIWALSSSPQPS